MTSVKTKSNCGCCCDFWVWFVVPSGRPSYKLLLEEEDDDDDDDGIDMDDDNDEEDDDDTVDDFEDDSNEDDEEEDDDEEEGENESEDDDDDDDDVETTNRDEFDETGVTSCDWILVDEAKSKLFLPSCFIVTRLLW